MREETRILAEYLRRKGLKQTSQRETVLRLFLEAPKHITVDDLTARVRQMDRRVGTSTVYRCLKLFTECGLALESKFQHGRTCFEHGHKATAHHHLICNRCGRIGEFENPLIEAVGEKVCRDLDFKAEETRLEIYGLCSACQGPKDARPEE
jgi:Fur family ferric uptake transcriptional regulator